MGEAILAPLLSTNTFTSDRVVVSHPRSDRREYIKAKYHVTVVPENGLISQCDILLLGIKPQQFQEIKQSLSVIKPNLVLSIMAGVSLQSLSEVFIDLPIVRAMPNTPAQIGAGMTAFSCNSLVQAEQRNQVIEILQAVGEVIEVPEKWMNVVTGLSGSGPGYIAVLIEALIDGAVLMGLPRSVAQTMAVQTVLGSAQYLKSTAIEPCLLKNKVTSPGGTTIAGIHALEYHGGRIALIEAVKAATLRSGELDR